MVSYFVPRGRFLAKTFNLRQTQNQQGKWPLLQNFRQTLATKHRDESLNINTNVAKPPQGSPDSLRCTCIQRPRSVLAKWTLFILRLAPVGICSFGAIEWQLHKRKCQQQQVPRTASDFQAKVYRSLPLRIISRCWGWLASCYIPASLRPFVFGWYSRVFNVNLEEALYSDYKHYNTLSEFFTRPLKDGVRVIDPDAPLVSPADGRVLHFGRASNSLIEQVKGVNYSMESFTGPPTWIEGSTLRKDLHYSETIKEINDGSTDLYQCVIYLAPGDYHRFHSPTHWQPVMRRHFPGELLSVSPRIAKWLPDLFCLNERVLYLGRWKYGFFSYTAVGATNVGSVQIYMDEALRTNRWIGLGIGAKKKLAYEEMRLEGGTELKKGDLIGQFNMGSTIVLIFEAPNTFKFAIKPGEKILVGAPLGYIGYK